MNTSRSLVIICLALFIVSFDANNVIAQEEESTTRIKNNALSIVPQYAFVNGLRLDYERRLGSGDIWLLVAPQLYIDNTPDSYYYSYSYSPSNEWSDYDYMRGGGANLYIKWNVNKSNKLDRLSGKPARLFYIAGGPSYQYFVLNRYDEITVTYVEDGTTYYKFDYQKIKYPIQRFGGHFNMGMQFAMDPFLIDIYIGFGGKLSKNENGENIGLTDVGFTSPAYSGLFFDGGFKFGVYF